MNALDDTALLRLNGIAVMEDGAVAPAPPARPALRFDWRGRACTAELTAEGMRLWALAGRVPSTAVAAARRSSVLAALPELAQRLPDGWRMHLSPDHRILVETASRGPYPTPVTALLSDMVRFALALDPLCDGLDAAGAELAPA
jgi:hypothetical protein